MTKQQIIDLTSASLSEAVSSALGMNVTMTMSIMTVGRKGRELLSATSGFIAPTGPAFFMFSSLVVGAFGGVWINDEDDNLVATFDLHWSYTHHGGGSNGCDAGTFGKRIRMELRKDHQFGDEKLQWKAVLY